jgi:hypothetical protein
VGRAIPERQEQREILVI